MTFCTRQYWFTVSNTFIVYTSDGKNTSFPDLDPTISVESPEDWSATPHRRHVGFAQGKGGIRRRPMGTRSSEIGLSSLKFWRRDISRYILVSPTTVWISKRMDVLRRSCWLASANAYAP